MWNYCIRILLCVFTNNNLKQEFLCKSNVTFIIILNIMFISSILWSKRPLILIILVTELPSTLFFYDYAPNPFKMNT